LSEEPTVSLIHYIDMRIADAAKMADMRSDFNKERVQWLEKKSDADRAEQQQKNANQNEWRGTLNDRDAKFAQAGETNIRFGASDAKTGEITTQLDLMRGRTAGAISVREIITWAVGLLVAGAVIYNTFRPH